MMSCTGTGHVGVNLDTEAIPDADTFLACLREGFDEVRDLATTHPSTRRPRGQGNPRANTTRRVPASG
jgi:hypothetical protein